jgi:hypothetical protein
MAITCDFRAYKDRNRVERMFKLKQFQRIATRPDTTRHDTTRQLTHSRVSWFSLLPSCGCQLMPTEYQLHANQPATFYIVTFCKPLATPCQ